MLAALTGDEGWEVWEKQGGDSLSEIRVCHLQGSGQKGVSGSSNCLFIRILEVQGVEERE